MARILLFNPPGPKGRGFTREGRCTQDTGVWTTSWPPISLTTAAAMLEADRHEVKVIDFPASGQHIDQLKIILCQTQPDGAIWSTASQTLAFDLSLAGLIKEQLPRAFTAVMGTHVTVCPDEALSEHSLDIVIRGEPEQIIRNFCRHWEKQGNHHWDSVRGISFRDPLDGCIYHNDAEPFISPADIPSPAWHCLDLRPYLLPLKGKPYLIVAPVRGCPFRCSFCTAPIYYGYTLRNRPVNLVITEIENNMRRYGISEFFIWADTFTADREYVRQFCSAILDRGLQISWTCNSRVDRVDEELLLLMKKAGLWMISFGIESGSNRILKRSGKRITVDQSRVAVLISKRVGIKSAGHFIFGLPGETEETMQETLRLALELPLDIAQFYTAVPSPGTELYREAQEMGWIKKNEDVPFTQSCAVMDLPGLPAVRVNAFRHRAYWKFYSRPSTIAKLLSMIEKDAVKTVFKNARFFSRWAVS